MGTERGRQLSLPFVTPQALGRRDFQPAPCNAQALAWLERWPNWPAHALVLSGPPGCGKTHLAHVFQEISGAVFLDPDGLGAVLEGDDGAPAWILDDMDRHLDGAAAQTTLFHLYNLAGETGRSLLLTGRQPPARWPVDLADLRSRLRAAPAAAIEAPDDAVLAGVLVKLFADRQIRPAPDVIAYVVPRMERSFQAARHLVARLDRLSLEGKRPVTVPLARQVLEDGD